jgi:hypothetical protein
MCVSTVSVRRPDWLDGEPVRAVTRTEVGAVRPDWSNDGLPDDTVTDEQVAALKQKFGVTDEVVEDDDDVDQDDDADRELDLTGINPDVEAGQAVADEILTSLNGVEATALDSALADASPNVRAHFANILMSGRKGEELIGFADALEELMSDEDRCEAHTFLRNLTDNQAQAIKRALGI